MSANNTTGDNRVLTNQINGDNVVVTFKRDLDQISSKSSGIRSVIPERNDDQNKCADNQLNNCPENKSSNRNTINFLGYFILVLIIFYGYFGSLITDLITKPNNVKTNAKENQNLTQNENQNSTNSESQDLTTNDNKFYRNVTSIELIAILWITIVYGSALLLYLRFRVLTLERDPNSEKNKKKDSTEELNAFLQNNRKNRRSFKDKILNTEVKAKDDSNQPFWQK